MRAISICWPITIISSLWWGAIICALGWEGFFIGRTGSFFLFFCFELYKAF